MNIFIKVTAVLVFIVMAGCGEDEALKAAANPEVFKNQQEALDKTKQVEDIVLDAAEQQQKIIEKEAQ